MRVIPFTYEDYDDLISNTFVLVDESNQCVVIDPGCKYEGINKYIEKNNLKLKAVLLTHGHFDHIRGVDTLINKHKVPLYIGFDDVEYLTNSYLNCSSEFSDHGFVVESKATPVSEGDVIDVLNEKIQVIYTPFHTAGSVCYYLKDSHILFTGDSLFYHGIGRTDLPGAKPKELRNSLRKIAELPDEVKVYPGHGPFTSLSYEHKTNPFVKN